MTTLLRLQQLRIKQRNVGINAPDAFNSVQPERFSSNGITKQKHALFSTLTSLHLLLSAARPPRTAGIHITNENKFAKCHSDISPSYSPKELSPKEKFWDKSRIFHHGNWFVNSH